MAWAIKKDGIWQELAGQGFRATVLVNGEADELRFPANWPDLATDDERAAMSIAAIVEAEPVGAGLRVLGSALEGDEIPLRVWVTEAIDLDELRQLSLARLAERRWQEQQTMDWNGQIVPSDDTTLTRIMATVKLAELQDKAAGDVVAQWKFGPGPLTAVTLGQVIAYGIAIGANLQACFNREAELAELVLDPDSDAEAILAAAEADWIAPD